MELSKTGAYAWGTGAAACIFATTAFLSINRANEEQKAQQAAYVAVQAKQVAEAIEAMRHRTIVGSDKSNKTSVTAAVASARVACSNSGTFTFCTTLGPQDLPALAFDKMPTRPGT